MPEGSEVIGRLLLRNNKVVAATPTTATKIIAKNHQSNPPNNPALHIFV